MHSNGVLLHETNIFLIELQEKTGLSLLPRNMQGGSKRDQTEPFNAETRRRIKKLKPWSDHGPNPDTGRTLPSFLRASASPRLTQFAFVGFQLTGRPTTEPSAPASLWPQKRPGAGLDPFRSNNL